MYYCYGEKRRRINYTRLQHWSIFDYCANICVCRNKTQQSHPTDNLIELDGVCRSANPSTNKSNHPDDSRYQLHKVNHGAEVLTNQLVHLTNKQSRRHGAYHCTDLLISGSVHCNPSHRYKS